MDALKGIITTLSTFVAVAGGLWLGWGMVVLGLGIKDTDGPGIRSGVLQLVGGGLVLAGGVYIGGLA